MSLPVEARNQLLGRIREQTTRPLSGRPQCRRIWPMAARLARPSGNDHMSVARLVVLPLAVLDLGHVEACLEEDAYCVLLTDRLVLLDIVLRQ